MEKLIKKIILILGFFVCIIIFLLDENRSWLSLFIGINFAHIIRGLKSYTTKCISDVSNDSIKKKAKIRQLILSLKKVERKKRTSG